MTKAYIFNVPSHGHVNPTLPLTRELVQRGEKVIYYCGQAFKEQITETGAEFRPLPYELTDILRAPRPPQINFGLLDCTWQCLPTLLEEAKQEAPDYIIFDFLCLWGKIVAEQVQCPAVATYPSFVLDGSELPPPVLFSLLAVFHPQERAARRLSKRIAHTYQTAEVNDLGLLTDIRGDLNIVFTSERFQPNSERLGQNYKFIGPVFPDDAHNASSFPLHELAGKQVIYVSLGTVFGHNKPFFIKCFKAFADSGFTVVISTGNAIPIDAFENVPSNIIIKEFVPQTEILKRTSLFVTHGGLNSISGAIYHQVPMIVVPQGIDQSLNAKQVQAHGVGVWLKTRWLRPQTLRQVAKEVLADKGIQQQLRILSDSFKEAGGYQRGATEIVEFVRGEKEN